MTTLKVIEAEKRPRREPKGKWEVCGIVRLKFYMFLARLFRLQASSPPRKWHGTLPTPTMLLASHSAFGDKASATPRAAFMTLQQTNITDLTFIVR